MFPDLLHPDICLIDLILVTHSAISRKRKRPGLCEHALAIRKRLQSAPGNAIAKRASALMVATSTRWLAHAACAI